MIRLRKGGVAIDNRAVGKTLYLRNLFIGGTHDLVRSGKRPTIHGSGAWSRIREYAYTDQRTPTGKPPYESGDRLFRTWSLIDGELSRDPEPVVSIERDTSPPTPDLHERHMRNELLSYEG